MHFIASNYYKQYFFVTLVQYFKWEELLGNQYLLQLINFFCKPANYRPTQIWNSKTAVDSLLLRCGGFRIEKKPRDSHAKVYKSVEYDHVSMFFVFPHFVVLIYPRCSLTVL